MTEESEKRRDDSLHRATPAGWQEDKASRTPLPPKEKVTEAEMPKILRNLEETTGFVPPEE